MAADSGKAGRVGRGQHGSELRLTFDAGPEGFAGTSETITMSGTSQQSAAIDSDFVHIGTEGQPAYITIGQELALAGTHDGGDTSASLIDSTATFITNGVRVGALVNNTTDSSSALVTGVTSETELAMTLAGGGENDWDDTEAYTIENIFADSTDYYLPANADRTFPITDGGVVAVLEAGTAGDIHISAVG